MTNKHEIKIKGLPDGWRAVAYRCPKSGEKFLIEDETHTALMDMAYPYLIVEKIQPRRIVLEETNEERYLRKVIIFTTVDA